MADYGEGGYGEEGFGGDSTGGDSDGESVWDTTGVWRSSTYEDPTLEILDLLPLYYNRDEGTPNWKLFEPIGQEIRKLDNDLEIIDFETRVQTAKDAGSLDELAREVDIARRDGEANEPFRARILAERQSLTSSGTANDLIIGMALSLGITPESISSFTESSEGYIDLKIPKIVFDGIGITEADAKELAEKMVSPTKRINTAQVGTFEPVSVTEYNDYETNGTWSNFTNGVGGAGIKVDAGETETTEGTLDIKNSYTVDIAGTLDIGAGTDSPYEWMGEGGTVGRPVGRISDDYEGFY